MPIPRLVPEDEEDEEEVRSPEPGLCAEERLLSPLFVGMRAENCTRVAPSLDGSVFN